MRKYLFLMGLMATGLALTACGEDDEKTIPEGTANVTIDEDDTRVTSDNLTNWTQYAVQVANLLTKDAINLYKAWAEDYNGNGAYAESFKNPGAGKTYASYQNCLQEIIEGCADIANEVGTAKIGEPRDLWEAGQYTEAVYAVESWYSFHSIDDYANNIRSIRNAFYGSRDNQMGAHSIASFLKENNSSLYDEVNTRILAAIKVIEGMAAPFRSHIGNNSVVAAQKACAELEKSLSNNLKPYMINRSNESLRDIVISYVDEVVLPTYEELVSLNKELNSAVRQLANTPDNAHFEKAAAAWMRARAPWESSEAFLFGPVAELGLDPNMDTWPLDVAALRNKLNSGHFDDLDWNGEFDEDDPVISAAMNVRGFHTLEFLLFKNGMPRSIE